MLFETERGILIKDLSDNLVFEYEEYTPELKVRRYGEGFRTEHPYILVEFLPANRPKFRSISDVIGNATENGQYLQYGYCQLEQVTIYCYCSEYANANKINGRIFTEQIANTVRLWILRNWEKLLLSMNASFERAEDLNIIRDLSAYDPNQESFIYCYSTSFFLRTSVRWDKIPDVFEGEEIVEEIGVFAKSTSEEEYDYLYRVKEE